MSATEDERVDLLAKKGREILFGDQARRFAVDPSFFDKRHK